MLIYLFLLGTFPAHISMPSEVKSINQVIWQEDGFLVRDSRTNSVFKCDKEGGLLASFQLTAKRTQLRGMAHGAGKTYLLDNHQTSLVVLDENLSRLDDLPLNAEGSCALAVTDRAIYLYNYRRDERSTVQVFDFEMKPLKSFGKPVDTTTTILRDRDKDIKYNGGSIVSHDGSLYLAPYFGFRIERYNEAGDATGTWQLPGLKAHHTLGNNGFKARCMSLMVDGKGMLYVALVRTTREELPFKDAYWRLDPKTGEWEQGSARPNFLYLAPDATFYRMKRTGGDFALEQETIRFSDRYR